MRGMKSKYGCLQWCGQECQHLLRLAFSSHLISFAHPQLGVLNFEYFTMLPWRTIPNSKFAVAHGYLIMALLIPIQVPIQVVVVHASINFIHNNVMYE